MKSIFLLNTIKINMFEITMEVKTCVHVKCVENDVLFDNVDIRNECNESVRHVNENNDALMQMNTEMANYTLVKLITGITFNDDFIRVFDVLLVKVKTFELIWMFWSEGQLDEKL